MPEVRVAGPPLLRQRPWLARSMGGLGGAGVYRRARAPRWSAWGGRDSGVDANGFGGAFSYSSVIFWRAARWSGRGGGYLGGEPIADVVPLGARAYGRCDFSFFFASAASSATSGCARRGVYRGARAPGVRPQGQVEQCACQG